MSIRLLLFCSFLLPQLVFAKISDAKIPYNIQTYFQRNRLGPELVSAEVFNHNLSGRTLKLKIIARRNLSGRDLAFAFAAAAAVAYHADKPIELLWVEMDINFKDSETTLAFAPANCTIDAIIFGNVETEKWWEDCLEIP